MQKPESVEVGPPTAAPSQASHPRAAAWLGSRAMSPACFTGRRRRRCHGTSPAAAGEGQAARSGDASERGASSAGPSAAASRGWPLAEAPPPSLTFISWPVAACDPSPRGGQWLGAGRRWRAALASATRCEEARPQGGPRPRAAASARSRPTMGRMAATQARNRRTQ